MNPDKKKRAANFTQEEKIKLINLIENHKVILNKQTDGSTNKAKDKAWENLSVCFNSCARLKRSAMSLKKTWNKMKSESKTYKAKQRCNQRGTGGGPSTVTDDPIFERVLNIVGRAGTGIGNVNDCDYVISSDNENQEEILMDLEVESDSSPITLALSPTPSLPPVETQEEIILPIDEDIAAQPTPVLNTSSAPSSSRRRPKIKISSADALTNLKLENEKKKGLLLDEERARQNAEESHKIIMRRLEQRKIEQEIKIRDIILGKLERNEEITPSESRFFY